MGRPYKVELGQLEETYLWARTVSVDGLVQALEPCLQGPIVAVGSGGSRTAAYFAALLHEFATGQPAKAMTPLELAGARLGARASSVLVISAGGSNQDILSAARGAETLEPTAIVGLCLRRNSPLSRALPSSDWSKVVAFQPPVQRDGFLATNSLAAFMLLLLRAYSRFTACEVELPPTLTDFCGVDSDGRCGGENERELLASVLAREVILVLHGPDSQPAAADIESKFSESGIGAVLLCDYRNFAHGRHNWLTLRRESSAVWALSCGDESALAKRTLRLVPRGVPIYHQHVVQSGPSAAAALVTQGLYKVGEAGEIKGLDPGRPKVAEFGRKMYGLRGGSRLGATKYGPEDVAIARKARCHPAQARRLPMYETWVAAHRGYVDLLVGREIGGVVSDYDGTLCDVANRFDALPRASGRLLTQLLDKDVRIGIATGRGKSVTAALRAGLPRRHWESVVIGYYNGSLLIPLSEDLPLSVGGSPAGPLGQVLKELQRSPSVRSMAVVEARATQVTLQCQRGAYLSPLWSLAQRIAEPNACKALSSGHSVDIVAESTSKRAVLDAVRARCTHDGHVLAFGDMGEYPGNDHELLATDCGLSVDQVSRDPESCWNLAAEGVRGPSALVSYGALLLSGAGRARFSREGLASLAGERGLL